ncbi:MAG TPA: tripartite tricarboxylate transporter substrate-binding protein [Xanthobacteraceae bacterium]|nr:tripartite tricarboxylate transporter substrate-binding protein [Xanthobacteraceae bacterium]
MPIIRSVARLALACLVFGAGSFLATQARAEYPERNITLIVPFAAGGPTDIISRLLADPLSRILRQQVVVENVVGGGGTVGVTRIARATPDGYSLLMGNLGTQAASVGLYPNLAYDPLKDFEPIMNTGGTPMIVAAKKDFPANDFREFVTYVKANAGKVNYGTGGVGATSHLTCLFLDSLMGVQPTHVPFRGSGPALNALLGGQVDYVCDQTVGVVPSIQGELIKGLVVAMPERLPAIPNVPTSAEQGLSEFQAVGWNAMFAPKGTPRNIVMRLNLAARAALADNNVQKRLADLSVVPPDDKAQTPEALRAFNASEIEKWVPIIKKSGVTAQ